MKNKTLIFIILTLGFSIKTFACNCSIPKSLELVQKYDYENSECIFIGEVFEVNKSENSFKIRIIESFKSNEKGTIYEGKYDGQCGPIIDTEGKWLIYADLDSENVLNVSSCGISRDFKNPELNITIDGLLFKEFKGSKDKSADKFNVRAKKELIDEIEKLRAKKE